MLKQNPAEKEVSVDEQRAQWEQFRFTVCENGVVNVQNLSYGAAEAKDHIYSVIPVDGQPVRCSCPHHQKRGAHCKHMVAVEQNPLVASAANAAASKKQVAADGGERQ